MSDLIQKIVFVIVPILTSWVFSDILEQQVWFHKLSGQTKSQLWIVLSALIGFVVYMLIQNAAPETIQQLTAGLAVISQIVAAYLGGTFYHQRLDDVTTTSTLLGSVVSGQYVGSAVPNTSSSNGETASLAQKYTDPINTAPTS